MSETGYLDGIRCRICGLQCVIADTEVGPVLKHLSAEVEADHTAVEDDGSYFESLPKGGRDG
jgi:hypothetical protein